MTHVLLPDARRASSAPSSPAAAQVPPTVPFSTSESPSDLRRWLVVAAATFGMMMAFAVTSSVAVVMKPLELEFGWLRADIAFAYTLLSAGAAIGGIVCGKASDMLDTRPIVAFGALVMGIGLVAMAWQNDLVTMQRLYLAIGVFGFACLYTPLLANVGLWFDKRRGLALGIVTAGGTMGQGLAPVLMQPLIAAFGWRGAYVALGLVCILVLLPAMLLVTKPARLVSDRPGAVAREDAGGWGLSPLVSMAWLGAAAIFCCTAMSVPIVHLVTLGADRGLSPGVSAALVMTVMAFGSVGRVAFGMFADRVGGLRSYALAAFLETVTVYWFVTLQSIPALFVLAAVFGFGFAGVMTSLIVTVREAVPARMVGTATAFVGLLAWLGMGIGGYQGGYCFDLTGSYAMSFANAAYAGMANLAIVGGLALHLWQRMRMQARQDIAADPRLAPSMT
jgi:MFS family permease